MVYYNLHTHSLEHACTGNAFYNYSYPEELPCDLPFHFSLSLHPWDLMQEKLDSQLEWFYSHLSDSRLVAIGETGLDKLKGPQFQVQLFVFKTLARISQEQNLPLIIHNVRSSSELIALKHQLKADNPWIIHGFRGKKELAKDLIRHGFYLSFGIHYQAAALEAVPLDRLFLETDTSDTPIATLYEQIAADYQIPVNQLDEIISQNINSLFFKR